MLLTLANRQESLKSTGPSRAKRVKGLDPSIIRSLRLLMVSIASEVMS